MKVRSRKNKGARLQKWVRDKVLALFPTLTERDVRSTGMGQGGEDIQLSEAAVKVFPYSVECKNQERFKTLYDIYEQAQAHNGSEPLVVLKMNHRIPLAVLSAEHFFKLVKANAQAD